MFDTLAIACRLTDAGLSDKQADALAKTLREPANHGTAGIDVETLAKKADPTARISILEARLYPDMLMQTAVTAGLPGLFLGHLRWLG